MEENTKNYVLDASYILNYLLPDEQWEAVMGFFQKHNERKINLISSTLLLFEVANSLRYAVKTKRINQEFAHKLLLRLTDLSIKLIEIDIHKALDLAFEHNISVYDAAYIALARQEKLPLLTLDKQLQKIIIQ